MKTLLVVLFSLLFAVPAVQAAEIHDAAARGDLARVQAIVARDPAQAVAKDGANQTPLHLAAAGGHVEVLAALLASGAPVDIGDNEGSTPLDTAAQRGQLEAVRLLVERGADVRHQDNFQMTPLHFAAYEGKDDVAGFLIERGADVNARKTGGGTPLHGAAFGDHVGTVRLLLEHGAEVDARNDAQYTPLLSAVAGRGGLEVVTSLVNEGAYVDARQLDGYTPLMFAAETGKLDAARYLVEHGASLDAMIDGAGFTALQLAARQGRVDVLSYLLDQGLPVDAGSSDGWTALHWAAMSNQTGAVQLLLDRGADVSLAARNGSVPVLAALSNGYDEIAGLLLEHGADPGAVEPTTGRALLHLAALGGMARTAGAILDRGAAIDPVDSYGMTPLRYAAKYGHRAVADLLTSRGADTRGIEGNYGRPLLLDRKVQKGEAALWYLGNCGWAVKTKNHLLIFDYWNEGGECDSPGLLNGHINPQEVADENVCVFVTHEHADHYDPAIFGWPGAVKDITYVYGFRPGDLTRAPDASYTGPAYQQIGPREQRTIDGIKVRTIRANDSGVGFLLEVDGVTIYHAGDHAGWADNERDGYFAEIDYLDGLTDKIDIAFVNVTGCHAHDPERLKEGTHYTLEKLAPKVMVPTHGSNREYVYRDAAEEIAGAGITTPVVYPENRGDSFFYSKGSMVAARS